MVHTNNFKQILILKIQAAVAPFLSCNFKSKPIKFADQYTHLHTLSFQKCQTTTSISWFLARKYKI